MTSLASAAATRRSVQTTEVAKMARKTRERGERAMVRSAIARLWTSAQPQWGALGNIREHTKLSSAGAHASRPRPVVARAPTELSLERRALSRLAQRENSRVVDSIGEKAEVVLLDGHRQERETCGMRPRVRS